MNPSLKGFFQIAQQIWEQLPPGTRFSLEDGQVLQKYQNALLEWENQLISGFYDTLFSYPTTKAVFREGERPMREQSLRLWFRRTIEGPFNNDYFAWQALVGLFHLRRHVTSAMIVVMWGWMTEQVRQLSRQTLPQADADRLTLAWSRLASTISALIAESQLEAYIQSLSETLGKDPKLLQAAAMGWLEEYHPHGNAN